MTRITFLTFLVLSLPLSLSCQGEGEPEVVPYSFDDVLVDGSGTADVAVPRLCSAGSNVYAVWHDDRRGGRNQVFFNVGRGGGQIWGEDVQLSADPSGTTEATAPDIGCAGDSVYVVWEDDRDSELGYRNIYFTYSDDGGRTWAATNARITQDERGEWDALGPRISVDYRPEFDANKYLSIAWYDGRSGAYDIYFTKAVNGYNFLETPLRLDTDVPGSAYSAHPILATDGLGGVYVAWEDSRSERNDVYINRSLDRGATWMSSDMRLDASESGLEADAFGVTLTVDRDATVPAVYVAWHDARNEAKDIFLNYSLDSGSTWLSEPVRLEVDAEGSSDSFFPTVTASDGRVLVAWQDARDGGQSILLRGSDNGGETWGSELRIDSDIAGGAHSIRPKMARDGETIALVWTDYRYGPEHEGDVQPDIYYRISTDGGYSFGESDGRVDDDLEATAISEGPQVVLSGPWAHILWVDYRMGNADLWFRAVPAEAL